MVVCICVEAQNNVLQLPSKQIQHEGYGNPLHHHHHNNNNNNRMLGFIVINQLWGEHSISLNYEFKNYDQGSQAFFWLFEACISQTSKQKIIKIRLGNGHLQCSSTKGEGTFCMYVCGTINHFCSNWGAGWVWLCEWYSRCLEWFLCTFKCLDHHDGGHRVVAMNI